MGASKAGLPKIGRPGPYLGAIGICVIAVAGLVGVVSVLIGVQCGGLDKCFAGKATETLAVVEPAEAAEPAVVEERLTPDPVVAVATAPEPVASPEQQQAEQIAAVIGGSFDAVKANDEGWLASARAAETAVAVAEAPANIVEEGDGDGPIAVAAVGTPSRATAAEAAITVATAPVVPLDRPEPLEVSAYATTPRTAPAVSAEARAKLDAVAEAAQPKAEPEPAAEPEPTKVAEAAEPADSGDLRTVGGSGVSVRSGPGKSHGRLFALRAGEQVKVLENQRGWLKVTDDQNRTGWLYQSYLR